MASMATMVLEALTALKTSKLTMEILKTCLQLAATPRDTEEFRSLRRVDKIVGKRDEGLPCKFDGERADGLSCIFFVGKSDASTTRKELAENEQMVSAANADFERRIAATWCGSKVADWRMVVLKTFASLAVMASIRRWPR